MVWDPLGPDGLWSTAAEVHLTIVAVALALLVAYLDWNRRRKLVLVAIVAVLAAGLVPREAIWKPWYFVVPFAAMFVAYAVVKRLCERRGIYFG